MKNSMTSSPSLEKVFAANRKCLVLEEVSGRGLGCIYHYHPEYELTYIVSGHGSVLIGSAVESFSPGHIALIGGNIPHHYASRENDEGEPLSMSRVIKFRDDCLGRYFFDLAEMGPLKLLLLEAQNGVAFAPLDGKKFHDRILSLFQANGPRQVVLFLDLLCGLATAPRHLLMTSPHPVQPKDVDTERMNLALNYINRHLCEKITLPQVSRVVGLSPLVFSRIFSRIVRKTFSQYILELRLDNACRLLTETERSISEVGYESGFQNISNFNRLFRKNRTMTPREYRRHIRENIC